MSRKYIVSVSVLNQTTSAFTSQRIYLWVKRLISVSVSGESSALLMTRADPAVLLGSVSQLSVDNQNDFNIIVDPYIPWYLTMWSIH